MAAPAAIQLRNVETSLLFMQQEHAKTLQALHQEIQKLQKKCSEMTFELAMKGDVDEDAYLQEIQRLEKLLREKTITCNNLQELLEKKDKRIGVLELQLRAQEKRYTDEIKQKNMKINSMKNDLDKKTGVLAVLRNEIQQMPLRPTQDMVQVPCEQDVARERLVSPLPPKNAVPNTRRRICIKKPLGPNMVNGNRSGPVKAVHLDGYTEVARSVDLHKGAGYRGSEQVKDSQRPKNSNRVIQPQSTNSGVFVVRQKEHTSNHDVIVRQRLSVLPPIVNENDVAVLDSDTQSALVVRKRSKPGMNEKETLAINCLILQDKLLQVDHSNSD